MEMCYNGTLVMPSNYAVINDNEMEYVDGGASFSRSWISLFVDVAALLVCPYLAPIKFMGKNLAKALVSRYLPKLSSAFAKVLKITLGISINMATGKLGNLIFGNIWCLTSVGGIIALTADYFSDGRVNGLVKI